MKLNKVILDMNIQLVNNLLMLLKIDMSVEEDL